MGRYEEVKTRRWSELAPGPSVMPSGLRKWSGGLMPGGAMGSYCAPPVNLLSGPAPCPAPPSKQKQKSKKVSDAYGRFRKIHQWNIPCKVFSKSFFLVNVWFYSACV